MDPYMSKSAAATPAAAPEAFNPLDPVQAMPYRNSFEPFAFRVITLGGIAVFYCLYFLVAFGMGLLVDSDFFLPAIFAVLGGFAFVFCCGVAFYFAKPDHFVKIDRVHMQLLITKTRSGGYCSNGPAESYDLASIGDIQAVQGAAACLGCLGRSFTIKVTFRDGRQMQLTPLTDLTQARAYDEAKKMRNALHQCRGEPLEL